MKHKFEDPNGPYDPLTVSYLASCLEDIPEGDEIVEIKTRNSRWFEGDELEDHYAVTITTNNSVYDFD